MSAPSRPDWNPALYAANARFVSDLGQPVVELLAPVAGERILDLGCGDGALTTALAERGCRVVGVDASPEMVSAARLRGLDVRVMRGEALAFDGEFDAVFSNAALHWMTRPLEVIDGVWRALRPGGRFVAEMGGQGNVAAIAHAIDSAVRRRGSTPQRPWYFPSAAEYRDLLERRGFTIERIELFPRPTALPGGLGGWLAAFGEPLLKGLREADREAVTKEVQETLAPQLRGADGTWIADYVRLRFAARRPV